jgi:hypothetical protein
MRLRRLLAATAAILVVAPGTAHADTYVTTKVVVPMVFPVVGRVSYVDSFLACRSGCARLHMGQDLMAAKMTPVVAAFNGTIHSIKRETTVGDGNYLTLKGDNGWSANYIHVNNDTPGTDDGRGTAAYSFAPGLRPGLRVVEGQLLGWVGDSGNAESTGPHLHFELRKGDPWSGVVHNAFWSLNAAPRLAAPVTSGPHPEGSYVKACALCPVYEVRDGKKRYLRREVAIERGWDGRSAVTVSSREIAYYPPSVDVPLPDGRVYRGPDEKLWLVTDETRIQVPDAAALAPLGIAATRIRPMTAAGLGTVRIAPAGTPLPATPFFEGALLKSATETWVVRDGVRRPVPDAYTLRTHGLNALDAVALPVSGEALNLLPAVGAPLVLADGAVVKDGANRLYVVSDGTRRAFPSWAVHRLYGWTPVLVTTPPAADLSRLPVGAPLP